MKVTDSKAFAPQIDKPEPRAVKGAAPGASGPVDGTPTRLSNLAGTLAALGSTLSATPEFDAARVDSIKQAIRDGRLAINPEAIADKLLASAAELLRKPH